MRTRTRTRGAMATAALAWLLTAASAPHTGVATGEEDALTARLGIGAMYEAWGAARVARDREAIERVLAPEFHARLLDGRKISRERFVRDVTTPGRTSELRRFDAEVLTVQRGVDEWTVVITEKLEALAPDAEHVACSLWVTRDECRREGEHWVVTSSEVLGSQAWAPGEEPPLANW